MADCEEERMKEKIKYYIGLSLLMAICFTGCGDETKTADNIPVVRTVTVGMSEENADWYAGRVCGRYEKNLAFQVGGKIISRAVDVGSRVSAGQVLLSLDADDVRQKLYAGTAQVERVESQERLAQADLVRYRQLYEADAISKAQYDQVVMQYESAQAAVKEAYANRAQLDNMLEYTDLSSDVSGTVSAINGEVGQVVAAGQTIVTLVQDGSMEVEIAVPENRLSEIQVGDKATVTFWAKENVTAQGVVREVAPMADAAVRTYRVRVAVDDMPQGVQLGMTARVYFGTQSDGMLTVPLSAVYQSGDQPSVWVVRDGVAMLTPIRTGSFNGNHIEVTGGLKAGDVVITAGVKKVSEGQRVRVSTGEIK